MTSVGQHQLAAIATSIAERMKHAHEGADENRGYVEGRSIPTSKLAAVEQALAELKASNAAERNLERSVLERLERDVAVMRGELAAFANERAEALVKVERLYRETQQAIDAMMSQVVSHLEERLRAV